MIGKETDKKDKIRENGITMNQHFSIYELKISLACDRYIYRIVSICGTNTLDDLSDLILESYDFDDEHLYLFKIEDKDECYYTIPNAGEKSTNIKIDQLQLAVKQKMMYLYDFGDEWIFKIMVRKIEAANTYKEPIILKSIGTVEQYPDYDDDYEEEIELKIIDNLKTIDILNKLDDDFIIEEYQVLFNYQRPATGKNSFKMRSEIAEEILEYPEHLMLFLPNQQLEFLESIIHLENVFRRQDKCGLMKLNSYGFCQIIESEAGFIIEIPSQIINVYKTYMTNSANRKIIKKKAELQKITEYLISKYGIIELDNLYKILCFIMNYNIEYTDFMILINSRLHYFGDFNIFQKNDQIQYITLFQEEDAMYVLEQRNTYDEYRNLTYPVFTLNHCRRAIKDNYYMEYEAYKEWWSYLQFDLTLENEICNGLLAITTYAALIQRKDEKILLKECRDLFHQGGCNFTRKAQRLILALLNGLPAAAEKGRTFAEFNKSGLIREGMYNSIEDAEAERQSKKVKKKETIVKTENKSYEQLTLF